MADTPKAHRLEEVLAYKQGFLSAEEMSRFEAHLSGCADCQETLKNASAFLGDLPSALAGTKTRTDEELVAAARAAAIRQGSARGPFSRRRFWFILATTAVLVLGFAVLAQIALQPHDRTVLTAPRR